MRENHFPKKMERADTAVVVVPKKMKDVSGVKKTKKSALQTAAAFARDARGDDNVFVSSRVTRGMYRVETKALALAVFTQMCDDVLDGLPVDRHLHVADVCSQLGARDNNAIPDNGRLSLLKVAPVSIRLRKYPRQVQHEISDLFKKYGAKRGVQCVFK